MATGTGTPATSASTLTLNTLRDRIRTQLEHAHGAPDPVPVLSSTETLATLRDRVELHLQDTGNAKWAADDVDEAIEKALEEYNRHSPRLAVTTLTLSADGREIDISSLSGILRVHKVWWPYDSAPAQAGVYPPAWAQFDIWPGELLYIDSRTEPATGEKVRIWYSTPALLSGLNGASSTTIPADDITYLINGACHYAARQRAVELSESLNVDSDVPKRLLDWAGEHGKAFRYGIRKDSPSWWRYAYAFDQADIDEAIRWAVGRFNEIAPQETITTLTLSSSGREIDLSTITDLLRVTRVWWPYESTNPEFPPQWIHYEVWGTGPSATLYIDSTSEPASGVVVRLWYQRLCTLNGLDGASTTTVPDEAETLIIQGAVGYVAEERIMEKPGYRVPRKFREWASARLRDFDRGLRAYARRRAATAAGLGQLPPLDRWDSRDSGST